MNVKVGENNKILIIIVKEGVWKWSNVNFLMVGKNMIIIFCFIKLDNVNKLKTVLL